jgi:hypothetical protein
MLGTPLISYPNSAEYAQLLNRHLDFKGNDKNFCLGRLGYIPQGTSDTPLLGYPNSAMYSHILNRHL